MRGANAVKRLGWAMTGRRRRASVALVYHRVADLHPDPWGLAVSPAHFEEHLQVLRRSYRPVKARELTLDGERGAPEAGTVAVTFDDGYADNVAQAKSRLERIDVPATFFVTTGAVGADEEFWWDDLARMLLEPGSLPPRLSSVTLGRSWDLGSARQYSSASAAENRHWRADRACPTRRHEVFLELWRLLVALPPATRAVVRAELREATGAPHAARPEFRTLTSDELGVLAGGDLVEVGSHGVTHSSLPGLAAAAQQDEVEASKRWLEERLGGVVLSFSYPFGRHSDTTVQVTADAGYAIAFTTEFGLVEHDSARLRLPRVVPPDVDGDRFAAWLQRIVTPRRPVAA